MFKRALLAAGCVGGSYGGKWQAQALATRRAGKGLWRTHQAQLGRLCVQLVVELLTGKDGPNGRFVFFRRRGDPGHATSW